MESSEQLLLQVPGTATAPRIEVMDPAIERRLRAFVAEWQDRPVRIALDERDDVTGHAADAAVLRVILEGDDDTEGHAISLRFPDADSARQFRTKLAAGVLVGALAVAGAGAAARVAPSIGSSAELGTTGGTTPITVPNVRADQAIAPAGGVSAPTSVHADQAIAPATGQSAPTSVHADQAIAPATGESAPTSVHADQAIAPEAGTVPNVHADQAIPEDEAAGSESRLPRGNEIR